MQVPSDRPTAAMKNPVIIGTFPATLGQLGHWRQLQEGGGAALNVSMRWRIDGAISDQAVSGAIAALVDRHEILRTCFHHTPEGNVIQQVLEQADCPPKFVDLRELPAEQADAELALLGQRETVKPFAFTDSQSPCPLMRALFVRTSDSSAVLQLTWHHLNMDGWSVGILIGEFGTIAAAIDSGQRAVLKSIDLHFGDYAMWQRDVLDGAALNHERDYWSRKLEGIRPFEVAPDHRVARGGNPGEIRSILLSKAVTDAFEAQARVRGHTMFSFGAAAAGAALHLMTGEQEVVIGTQMAGRADADAQAVVGPLLNTVLLRMPFADSSEFGTFADAARETIREAMEHQALPFEEVRRTLADTANFTVNFNLKRAYSDKERRSKSATSRFEIIPLSSHSAGALWDLNLFMIGREEGWRISCEGDAARFDSATIDCLLDTWRGVIEAAASQPDMVMAALQVDLPAGRSRKQSSALPTSMDSSPMPAINHRIEAVKSRILPLQAEGEKTAIHAINCASILYPVAREIGEDRPFYDLQICPYETQTNLPHRHFVDHARDVVEMIRLAQPKGPYVLFGLCVCGALAIEAARLLQEEGEEVPLVILNDTYRPGFREHLGFYDRNVRAWQVRWRTFQKLRARVQSGELSIAQWIDNYSVFRKLRVTALLTRLGILKGGEWQDALDHGSRWYFENVLLPSQANFEMQPYRGRVALFRSEDAGAGRLFPHDFAWNGFVDGTLEIIECPGTHDTMFRDAGAKVIAAHVRRILNESQR